MVLKPPYLFGVGIILEKSDFKKDSVFLSHTRQRTPVFWFALNRAGESVRPYLRNNDPTIRAVISAPFMFRWLCFSQI